LAVCGWGGYRDPQPIAGVSVRLNTFEECNIAIAVGGEVKRVQIVGNRIRRATVSGIQVENLMPGASDVLIANNTVFECANPFRLWDGAPRGENIRLSNNLVLGRPGEADMLFVDSGGDPNRARGGFGDGKAVLAVWRMDHNWRELQSDKGWNRGWIPVAAGDRWQPRIEGVGRDPAAAADFLRPAKDSPLATGGTAPT
jgi:hypothetical protein